MAFLSVIVPIYKVEQYLNKCIESIINQTFDDIEVILVDDGSPDGCPLICDGYASKDCRVKVIHKKNGGLVSARKAGVQAAMGRYIAFVDGDDYIDADMYQEMCAIAKSTGADIVVEGIKYIYANNIEVWKDSVKTGYYNKEILEKNVYPRMMCHSNKMERSVSPSLCNKIFERKIISSVITNMNEKIRDGEDAAVTYPCFLKAESVYFWQEGCGYNYQINLESMSNKYDKNWVENASEYCRWIEDNISNEKLQESVLLEQFRMLYRYAKREFDYCLINKCLFDKRIRTIIEDTIVGGSINKIDIKKMDIPYVEKLQFATMKYGYYKLCKYLYMLRYCYSSICLLVKRKCIEEIDISND